MKTTEEKEKCELGCVVFYGGEIKHHKDCVFYPGSRTKMYDDAIERIKTLESTIKELTKSFEYYAYVKEPKTKENYDEYDKMMGPIWKQVKELLNTN